MLKNPMKKGVLTENSVGIGTVTRTMVRARAVQQAVIDGHSAHEATRAEWDQAKLELTGDMDTNPGEADLEAAPEADRWEPMHGWGGGKAPVPPGEDEDDEGRSDSEQLVEEGIAGAEHDHRLQAAKAALADDKDAS